MDREEAIRRAEIAMAWARGEDVQFQINNDNQWVDAKPPETGNSPAFFSHEWRKKPKPLECWVWCWVEKDGTVSFSDQRVRREKPPELNGCGRWVRMREVDE